MGYRGKVELQNQVRDLRAQGWTLTEICEQVGCSKASASLWCRDVELDEAVLDERRRERFLAGNEGARNRGPNKLQQRKAAEIEAARLEGIDSIGSLSDREFLVAGLAYYSGEGGKTDGAVKFANSDPRLLLFFVRWLRHFFEVDESRLRVKLYLHQGLDLEAANVFWSELTGIPTSQFIKPYRAVPDRPVDPNLEAPLGCPAISYSCTRTHRRIMGMIDALLSCPDSEDGFQPTSEAINPG